MATPVPSVPHWFLTVTSAAAMGRASNAVSTLISLRLPLATDAICRSQTVSDVHNSTTLPQLPTPLSTAANVCKVSMPLRPVASRVRPTASNASPTMCASRASSSTSFLQEPARPNAHNTARVAMTMERASSASRPLSNQAPPVSAALSPV